VTHNLPASTYCNDPLARFVVSSHGPDSFGIQGYFTSDWDAHRVAAHLKKAGHTHVSVDPYDAETGRKPGIHSLVDAGVKGYLMESNG
jgi:hypothetical protein